jgi:histidine triad (HIT) family protein
MSDCIFCKIVKKEIPSHSIYEDNNVIAFLDIAPINRGHTLVVPKHHYKTLTDLPIETLKQTMDAVHKIVEKIKQSELKMNAYNILQSNGKDAGQVINHVHFHIIPRYENDNLKLDINPDRAQYSQEQLADIAKAIG